MPKKNFSFGTTSEVLGDFFHDGKPLRTKIKTKTDDGDVLTERKKRVRSTELPEISEIRSQKQADVLLEEIKKHLDLTLLEKVLKVSQISGTYVTPFALEVLVGKALISGYLDKAKKIKELAQQCKNDNLSDIRVTNAYFEDFYKRGKRSHRTPSEYKHLMMMTLIRQADYDVIEFALSNTDDEYSIAEAYVRDGEMVFSNWDQTREVAEMTPAERLLECMPQTKIFDTYFEPETPLSAILKNRSAKIKDNAKDGSTEKRSKAVARKEQSKKLIDLLVAHGADILGNHYQAFKVAARFELLPELPLLMKEVRKMLKEGKKKLYNRHVHQIYTHLLAYSAMENHRNVIDAVRTMVDNQSSLKKAKVQGTVVPTRFPRLIQEAVKSLVELGTEQICTFRFRLLNGIYLLLLVQQETTATTVYSAPEAKPPRPSRAAASNRESFDVDISMFESNEPDRRPRERMPYGKFSILCVSRKTNYNAAAEALNQPGVGVLNFSKSLNVVSGPNISSSASDAGSVYSERSGSQSNVAGRKKTSMIKSFQLFQWFTNVMSQGDYNGENICLVLFALGLRRYFQPNIKLNQKTDGNASDASSAWPDEGTDNEDAQSDVRSVNSDHSDSRSATSRSTGASSSGTRRRRSTLKDVMNFMSALGATVQHQVNKAAGKALNTKQKVETLELASSFGSSKILEELLELIAPEFDKKLLKCINLATLKHKNDTGKMLLNKVTAHFDVVLMETQMRKDEQEKVVAGNAPILSAKINGPMGGFGMVSGRNRPQKSRALEFIDAVNSYFLELENTSKALKESKQNDRAKNKIVKMNSTVPISSRRSRARSKSITSQMADGLLTGTERLRRRSLAVIDVLIEKSGKLIGGGMKTKKRSQVKDNDSDVDSDDSEAGPKKKQSFVQSVLLRASTVTSNFAASNPRPNGSPTANGFSNTRTLANRQKELARVRTVDQEQNKYENEEDALRGTFSKYLLKLYEISLRVGSFEITETILENKHINKEKAIDVGVERLKVAVSTRPKNGTNTQPLVFLVNLLHNKIGMSSKRMQALVRDLMTLCVSKTPERVDNLAAIVSAVNDCTGGRFLTLDDAISMLKLSTQYDHWDRWDAFLIIVYGNLSAQAKQNFASDFPDMLKKEKLDKALPPVAFDSVADWFGKYNIPVKNLKASTKQRHHSSISPLAPRRTSQFSALRRGSGANNGNNGSNKNVRLKNKKK